MRLQPELWQSYVACQKAARGCHTLALLTALYALQAFVSTSPPPTHTHTKTGYAYISNVAVSPSAQRRGVARRLMVEAEALAVSWGCSKAGLHVNLANTPAVGLYRCACASWVLLTCACLCQRVNHPG
jgi:ribosomal protein S18 acetylase RimI-like enzyme